MNLKNLREYSLVFYLLLLAGGLFFTLSSLYGLFATSIEPDFIKDLNGFLGDWVPWVLVVALFAILFGAWYTYDSILKKSEFKEYINSESKAKFLKNLKDLEMIAYKLGHKHEELVNEKKKEWKVK